METRRVQAGEGAELRELRLRALADAPYAFATTLAEAQQVPMENWEERARRHAAGERDVMFVAMEDDHWCALAGGYFLAEEPGVVELFSMWVDPDSRRSGLGLSLVEAVTGWARERGARQIQLWVGKGNFAARTLYRRAGFADTDATRPLPSNEAIEMIMMRRDL